MPAVWPAAPEAAPHVTLRDRRIALVCMTPIPDANETGSMEMPSYGIRRILASLAADPVAGQAKYTLIDFRKPDVHDYVDAIVGFEPDLVGISVYIWSTECLVAVAREVKRRLPGCTIVFGGPSARTSVFDLPPYPEPHDFLDAVVAAEGEVTFCEIARLPELSRRGLETVPGLDLPGAGGWKKTGPRTPIPDLDAIASPFQLELMPRHSVAYLETYRGCPMSCRFCEWGDPDRAGGVFSVDYLVRELEAYAKSDVSAVFSVDAGLNLNAKAFRNLLAAEERVGLFKQTTLWCEIYPSHVTDEHLQFLRTVRASYLGIGLQSTDPTVLAGLDRAWKPERLESVVRQLADLADAELQIIFGLPGDTPEGFLRTLAYARSLGTAVRAYHCLVLPDALLTRGRPGWDMHFDPLTHEMISCQGWSAEALQEMRATVSAAARESGGAVGNYWWYFPPEGAASASISAS